MKTCKKLLAVTIALVLLVSTFVSGLVVSAAEPYSVTIADTEITAGDDATVNVTVDFNGDAISALHMLATVETDLAIADAEIVSVDYADGYEDPGDSELEIPALRIKNDGKNLEAGKILFESGVDGAVKATEVVFALTFADVAEGTYAIAINVESTDYNEADFAPLSDEGEIVVKPAHVCEGTVLSDNGNGTHDVKCECGEVVTAGVACEYVDGFCACGAKEPVVEPEEPILDSGIEFKHALNLASDIAITFRVPVDDLAGYDMDTVYAEAYKDVYTFGENPVKSTSEITRIDYIYAEADSRYDFKFSGLTAREMGSTVYIRVYGEKGGVLYCSELHPYSVKDYCIAAGKKGGNLGKLGATLAYYGECAQNYRDYCKNDLVSGGDMAQYMSQRLKADMSKYSDNKKTDDNPNGINAATKWSRALMLNEVLGLNCIVDLNAEYASRHQELTLRYTYNSIDKGTITENVSLNPYANTTNRFNLEYYGLKSYEFDIPITFSVYDGETQISSSYSTCVNDWCVAAYKAYGTENVSGALAEAIVSYNEAAEIYFNKVH